MQDGVYIPLVTPFLNGEIDYSSFGKLIDRYLGKDVTGLYIAVTTGEAPTLFDEEYFALISYALERVNSRVPVYAGLSEHNTRLLVQLVENLEEYPIAGILSSCPYYNLPGQQGIYEHFLRLSEATPHNIIVYNIPYRTGRNIENDTIRKLAELKNIIGLKDSCSNINQTMELLLHRPDNFAVFAGHDTDFFLNLALGGDGGILASAHICTEQFIRIVQEFQLNNIESARSVWASLLPIIPALFQEPNPAPIKYILAANGIIQSDEVRLPLTGISEELKRILNKIKIESFEEGV